MRALQDDTLLISAFALVGLASNAVKRTRAKSESRPTAFAGGVLMIGVSAALGLSFTGDQASGSSSRSLPVPAIAPPDPPPFLLREVDPQTAASLNAKIPFSTDPNFAAKPFQLTGSEEARRRALECLTLAVYYEAANQGEDGGAAVAQVVINRLHHPAFPRSLCGVVFQGSERRTGCQFTFTCDGSLVRARSASLWERSRKIAEAALNGTVYAPVGLATHYHADYVVPYWATSLAKNAQVGAHIFYRWPGPWGEPRSFTRRYAGFEVDPVMLEGAALSRALSRFQPDDLVEVGADPRVELLGVVQLLATEGLAPSDDDSQYEKDAKAYFQTEAGHRAVQLFRSLTAASPSFVQTAIEAAFKSNPIDKAAPGPSAGTAAAESTDADLSKFEQALGDFAQSSEFDRFFAGHQPYYRRLARAGNAVAIANAQWQAYTGFKVEKRKVIVSALLRTPAATTCGKTAGAAPRYTPIAGLKTGFDADAFLATGVPALSIGVPPSVRDQIVRAVFVRIAALTNGDDAARKLAAHEVALGFDLVPRFEASLRDFESNRADYTTLATYLPRLLATEKQRLAKSLLPPKEAVGCPTAIAAGAGVEKARS